MSDEAKVVQYFRDNDREMRWIRDDKELIVFLYPFDMEDFCKLIEDVAPSITDDGGWEVIITGSMTIYFCVTISDLCSHIGMDPELLLTKKEGENT